MNKNTPADAEKAPLSIDNAVALYFGKRLANCRADAPKVLPPTPVKTIPTISQLGLSKYNNKILYINIKLGI